MSENCKMCLFYSDNTNFCDFGNGKILKPEEAKEDDFNVTECPFFTRSSHFERTPEATKLEILKDRRERASKYYL